MKVAALILVGLFGGLQTIAFTDCCCGLECPRQEKNDCQSCPREKEEPNPASHEKSDCCGESQSSPAPCPEKPTEKSCVHIEPSSDVVVQSADLAPTPFVAFVVALVETALPHPNLFAEPGTEEECVQPARGRPLYLLNSTLLI